MKRQIIGMLGAKGAGKDTAAAFLVNERGFVRVAFADKLYAEVAQAFGVTTAFLGDRTMVHTPSGPVEHKEHPSPRLALRNCANPAFVQCVFEELRDGQGRPLSKATPLSPREIMQLWGTEYRRKRGQDSYWLDAVKAVLDANPQVSFVITDVRFPNEFAFVGQVNGCTVRIRNLEVEAQEAASRAAAGSATHSSETALANYRAQTDIFNVKGALEQLRKDVLDAVDGFVLAEAI